MVAETKDEGSSHRVPEHDSKCHCGSSVRHFMEAGSGEGVGGGRARLVCIVTCYKAASD